jgi:NAD(P)-dependent dehydrogenase (short-subunit alcohol dehydrogenase family)
MDKVIVITGGSRGIGAATALLAARQGYRICINYLADDARPMKCWSRFAHWVPGHQRAGRCQQ